MPDYKAMYFELFRASVQAVQLLQDAQAHAEQQLLAEDAAAAGAARWGRVNPLSLTASPSPSLLRKSTSPKGRGKSFTVTFLALPLGELARSA